MTMPNTIMTNLTHTMPSRSEVEDFLFHEAALLDEWRLDDWLGLLTEDASYRVPPNDTPQGDHRDTLFTVADDIRRIRARVTRLKDRNAHAEYPLSRTRRMIANVRLLPVNGALPDNELEVLSNYVVYRFRREERIREYVGQYRHRLRLVDGQLRIAARTVLIDAHELGSLGSVSFIL